MGRQAPGTARVVQAHTGAEFESGAVHRARGVNEPVPGVEPDEPAGAGEWAGGHDNFHQVSGRQKRLRSTPHSKVVDDPRRSKARGRCCDDAAIGRGGGVEAKAEWDRSQYTAVTHQ